MATQIGSGHAVRAPSTDFPRGQSTMRPSTRLTAQPSPTTTQSLTMLRIPANGRFARYSSSRMRP